MKFFKILVMAILASFLVMGCSGSSSSDNDDARPPEQTIPLTKEMIVGTFYVYEDDMKIWTKVDIDEDGTARYKNSEESGSGSWEIEEGKVVFTMDNGESSTYSLVSQTETSYDMYGVDEEGGYYETWYKQQEFTVDMLDGKTYQVQDGDETCNLTFESTQVTIDCGGETQTGVYSIDEDGALVLDDNGEDDKHYLMKLEADGFFAWNEDTASRWTLTEGDEGIPLTEEMVIGTFYIYNDEQPVTKVVIDEDGTATYLNSDTNGNGTWKISDGKLIFTDSEDGEITTFSLVDKTDTSLQMYDEDGGYNEMWYKQQKFTTEMLVGKTYHIVDDESCDVSFSESTLSAVCSGESEPIEIAYSIDEDGVLVLDDDGEEDKHYLMKLEDDGFTVWNGDIASRWTLTEGNAGIPSTDEDGETSTPLTEEMVIGTFYIYEGNIPFTRVVINEDKTAYYIESDDSGRGTWKIENGKLVFVSNAEQMIFSLVSQTDTSFKMHHEEDNINRIWYKQQKFTKEMLVGNSYHVVGEDNCDVRFGEDVATVMCSGDDAPVDIAYIIDEDGVLVADDDGEEDKHYLIKLENNGSFFAWNEDMAVRWVLQD
jgi:hypothetical protein